MAQEGETRAPSRAHAHPAFVAGRARLLRRLGWRGADILAGLRSSFERELAERVGFHWLAVAFGGGSIVYFGLPREPAGWALLSTTLVLAIAAFISHQRGTPLRLVIVLAVLVAGATAGKLRVDRLDTLHVERPFAAGFTGRVVGREDRVELTPRIVLDRLTTDAEWIKELPPRVRLTVGEQYGLPPLGARIELRGR